MEKEYDMKFLIPTEPDDTHAILAKLALENLGHRVTMLFTADQPTRQKNSIFVDEAQYRWQSASQHEVALDNDFDVVWWRRARKPYVPKDIAHPDDYAFVVRENALFYESFTCNLAPDAWWINNKEAANRANFKLLQLRMASRCGMTIPHTLCSNDPKEIRNFLLTHEGDGVIYKPLCSHFWFDEEQIKISYTSRIQFLDLPNNQSLQRTPGIFQKEIKKLYELRVTCFGDYLVAAKLDSQVHSDGKVDWRAIRMGKMLVEPYKLPDYLEDNIRSFMKELGIVFGSFDFIVTPEGEYVFLEVNEQGQFLWIEEYNPAFQMLDIFVQFLQNQSERFIWNAAASEHTIERYREGINSLLVENMKRHVDLNCAKMQKTIN